MSECGCAGPTVLPPPAPTSFARHSRSASIFASMGPMYCARLSICAGNVGDSAGIYRGDVDFHCCDADRHVEGTLTFPTAQHNTSITSLDVKDNSISYSHVMSQVRNSLSLPFSSCGPCTCSCSSCTAHASVHALQLTIPRSHLRSCDRRSSTLRA